MVTKQVQSALVVGTFDYSPLESQVAQQPRGFADELDREASES